MTTFFHPGHATLRKLIPNKEDRRAFVREMLLTECYGRGLTTRALLVRMRRHVPEATNEEARAVVSFLKSI